MTLFEVYIDCVVFEQTITYWPDTGDVSQQEYGLITVTVEEQTDKSNYTVTTFRLVHTTVSTSELANKKMHQLLTGREVSGYKTLLV